MDNVTHTLIGALVGEVAVRAVPAGSEPQATLRRELFLPVIVVGSNLPDIDLLFSFGPGGKLAYMLEHRGYTHTAVGALFASAAILAVCAFILRRRGVALTLPDRATLVVLALLGPSLHLALDYLNSYGVHPWWPFDDRWIYGDSLFIVEPLYWASCAPLAWLSRSRAARASVGLALAAGLYLAVVTPMVGRASTLAYAALTLALLAVGRFATTAVALAVALAAVLMTTATFALAGHEADRVVGASAAATWADWTTRDRVLTPRPMNPFCWDAIVVQDRADRYALRRGVAMLSPLATRACVAAVSTRATAPMQKLDRDGGSAVHWRDEFVGSRTQLRSLAAHSCVVSAFLRFARTPWVGEAPSQVVGDLRFDRGPELGFAELDLAAPPPCPRYVPPWVPPRADLLRP